MKRIFILMIVLLLGLTACNGSSVPVITDSSMLVSMEQMPLHTPFVEQTPFQAPPQEGPRRLYKMNRGYGKQGIMDSDGNIVYAAQNQSAYFITHTVFDNTAQDGVWYECRNIAVDVESRAKTASNKEEFKDTVLALGDLEGNLLTERKYSGFIGVGNVVFAQISQGALVDVLNSSTGERIETLQFEGNDTWGYYGNCFSNGEKIYFTMQTETAILSKDGQLLDMRSVSVEKMVSGESDRFIARTTNNQYGLMDENLFWILPPQYGLLSTPDKNGNMIAVPGGGNIDYAKRGLINKNGKWVVQPEYSSIEQGLNESNEKDFDYYIVSKDGKCGAVNLAFEEVIPMKFESCEAFRDVFICGVSNFGEDSVQVLDASGERMYGRSFKYTSGAFQSHKYLLANGGGQDFVLFPDGRMLRIEKEKILKHYEKFGGFNEIWIAKSNIWEYVRVEGIANDKKYLRNYMDLEGVLLFEPTFTMFATMLEEAYMLWLNDGRVGRFYALMEQGDKIDASDLFVLTHNAREKQGLQAIVDSKGTVLIDNLKSIDFCDGYRLIGQRGFEWGMMDMQGNWIYSESIFGGLED
ncbi:WG repeat-containing protein [Clostridia bacterium OttesenSCG-928-F22]|nr:WG repeat-containing protein [Clostridia bacterium OttesenSCG-928-F22]